MSTRNAPFLIAECYRGGIAETPSQRTVFILGARRMLDPTTGSSELVVTRG